MLQNKFYRIFAISSISLIIFSPLAKAQSSNPSELQEIYACKSINSPEKRLACYDNSVGRFQAAEKSGDVITVSKSEIEKVEKDAFGFNIPSLPSLGKLFGGKTNSKEIINNATTKENDLTAPVKEASRVVTPTTPRSAPVLDNKPKPTTVKDVTLDIRKTTEFGYKKTRFFMENGQVWEQTDTNTVRVPKVRNGKSNTVNISKASLGSFFLRVNGKGAAIRVRRVR